MSGQHTPGHRMAPVFWYSWDWDRQGARAFVISFTLSMDRTGDLESFRHEKRSKEMATKLDNGEKEFWWHLGRNAQRRQYV